MKYFVKTIVFIYFLSISFVCAQDYYILNDKCINDLYFDAAKYFQGTDIHPIRDSRGIILRYEFSDINAEYEDMSIEIYKKIEYFLAKIENPAIIEVHTGIFSDRKSSKLKNWEISTVLANRIETLIKVPSGTVPDDKIHSVGYGEFLPAKNTSNNGGKYSNRVDIIILCNISGE